MPTMEIKKHGTVQTFNISPRGSYEGLLLKTKTELIQINFPQEFGPTVANLAPEGTEIQVEVQPEEGKKHASHPVYRLLRITNGDRKNLLMNHSNGNGAESFSGKVDRLNYALHGEVNGAILDTGDFLHLKPHGASALDLEIGMRVKGKGSMKPMIGGHRVIEAEEVNGICIEKAPKSRKKVAHK